MYYTCFKLSQLGLNVMPTSRNAKGPDVVAYTADGARFFTFQVKAMSKLSNVNVGLTLSAVRAMWWVLIVGVGDDPKALILTPDEVRNSCREYQQKFWAQGAQLSKINDANDNWQRVLEEEYSHLSFVCAD